MKVSEEYVEPLFERIPRKNPIRDPLTLKLFGCEGKRQYDRAVEAKHVARRLHGVAPYFCRVCRYYHVGNRTKTEVK